MSCRPGNLRRALALHRAGRLAEARACYEEILRHDPGNPSALHALGLVDLAEGRTEEAIGLLRRCLVLRPRFPEALTNLGRALLAQNRPLEALAAHEASLAIDPRRAESHGNLGNTLKALRRPEEALAAYRRALQIWPDSADLKYNEALVRLQMGDWRRGWENFECRWDCRRGSGRRPFAQPRWQTGMPLRGKSILVHAEQGLGDTLQFVRYLPLLAQQGAEVHLEVQPALQTFLAAQSLARTVSARDASLPEFDLHCPLLSLPGAFATGPDSIPAAAGSYLKAPEGKAAEWRRRLAGKSGPKIGLVWSGNAAHQHDRHRSIPLADFRRIVREVAGSFYSLQKDVRPGDAVILATLPEVTDLGPHLRDFTETAAIVANLDLVITVDTAVAHLAGALGTPAWLLLSSAPDWRWLWDRTDSPWYASLRLFRQPAPGDWAAVFDAVRDAGTRLPPGSEPGRILVRG